MDKLMKLLTLDPLKGSRTKLIIWVGVILYAASQLLPQYVSPALWDKIAPILALAGTYFGVEHFEKK